MFFRATNGYRRRKKTARSVEICFHWLIKRKNKDREGERIRVVHRDEVEITTKNGREEVMTAVWIELAAVVRSERDSDMIMMISLVIEIDNLDNKEKLSFKTKHLVFKIIFDFLSFFITNVIVKRKKFWYLAVCDYYILFKLLSPRYVWYKYNT